MRRAASSSFEERSHPASVQSPQLLVGVPARAQQTSPPDAQTPSLHQEVSALRPAVTQAQQVGRHWVGSVQALPGAPSPQVTRLSAPWQTPFSLALAIEPASVTATGDELQVDTAPLSREQSTRHASKTVPATELNFRHLSLALCGHRTRSPRDRQPRQVATRVTADHPPAPDALG